MAQAKQPRNFINVQAKPGQKNLYENNAGVSTGGGTINTVIKPINEAR